MLSKEDPLRIPLYRFTPQKIQLLNEGQIHLLPFRKEDQF